jgi:hypothetical protein
MPYVNYAAAFQIHHDGDKLAFASQIHLINGDITNIFEGNGLVLFL